MHEEQDPDFVIDFDPELTELLFRYRELIQLRTDSEKNLATDSWDEKHSKILIENVTREIAHIERIIKKVIDDYLNDDGSYGQLQ